MFIHAPIARSRSATKAITWRVFGSLDTAVLSFLVPFLFHVPWKQSAGIALTIAAFETVTKIVLFYLHERMWARVPWGRADKVVEEVAAKPADDTSA
ncbi:MAG TPA: DUF2061 domain-containing protein [Caulobacteraceae bacterium]